MNISIYGAKDWEQDYLKEKISGFAPDSKITFIDGIVSGEKIPSSETEILCVFVDSTVNKTVIEKLPNLKMIVTRSTGFDHIDLAYAKEKNIPVTYVPSYGENTVAEFTFALILALSRKLYQSIDNFRETGSYSFEGLMGFDLKGKTLGVIGTGRIGCCVIKMAKGFDMNVVSYDPYPNMAKLQELGCINKNTIEEVLTESDIVTLHVPYMAENHHLINDKTIAMMKKGAIIINTARGPLVDTVALLSAIKSGHLGGAGLDVLEEEGVLKDEAKFALDKSTDHDAKIMIANHVLADMPNVLITPHTAFNTREAITRILDTTLGNIEGFIKGEIKNPVPQN